MEKKLKVIIVFKIKAAVYIYSVLSRFSGGRESVGSSVEVTGQIGDMSSSCDGLMCVNVFVQ